MYFSYDSATKTHQYHGRVSPTRFAQLSHIIYSRSHRAADTQKHKLHKVVYFTYLIFRLCLYSVLVSELVAVPLPSSEQGRMKVIDWFL